MDSPNTHPAITVSTRMRLRDVVPGVFLGDLQPGPLNSLTDVPGVKAHTQEIFSNDGSVNTGVTCILPRDEWFRKACHAGVFSFNGAGEMSGSHWINESGLLHSPIVITNSFSIGACHEGVYKYAFKTLGGQDGMIDWCLLPVVAETFDGYLNNLSRFAVRPEHVVSGLENVSSGRVREGNTGGGTGMICHHFKGGTGSSSRVVPGVDAKGDPRTYTMAALVQANYDSPNHLRISGVPVGRILAERKAKATVADPDRRAEEEKLKREKDRKDGSIIVVLATDAPLHSTQLQRIAKRATVGLARVGGQGNNSSGDIFLAFSTANEIPVPGMMGSFDPRTPRLLTADVLDDATINGLFEAAADATEESIYNALCAAETMVGNLGHRVEALPLSLLKQIMDKHMC